MKTILANTGLGEFFRSLLPHLAKKQIIIDVTHSYDELQQVIIPMYALNIDGSFKTEVSTALEKKMKKSSIDFHKNAYTTINRLLKVISDQEEKVMKCLNSTFATEVIKDVLDYRRLNIIFYLEALNFLNDYARRYILVLVHEEFDSQIASRITGPVDKAARTWIMDDRNMESFVQVLEVLGQPFESFLKKLEDLDGHIFNPDEYEAIKGIQQGKIDPYAFGFVPVRWNPVYHVGIVINTWRVIRYERNQEEVAKLQLMLLALQEQKAKTTDKAKLENLEEQINYRSNQINILNAKIEDMEDQG